MRTYTAFWKDDHSKILGRRLRLGRMQEVLRSLHARVIPDARSTIGRLDGGDELEWALFDVRGKTLVVIRDDRAK